MKIEVQERLGSIEWQPPPHILEMMQRQSPKDQADGQEFLAQVFDGFLLLLLSCAKSEDGAEWMEVELRKLVAAGVLMFGLPPDPK